MPTYLPIVVNVILLLSAYYVHRRLVPKTWRWSVRFFAFLTLTALAACLPAQFLLRDAFRANGYGIVSSMVLYGLGLYSLLLTFTIARDIFLLCFGIKPISKAVTDERRAFLRNSSRWGVLGATAGMFGYAAQRALADPTVVHVSVAIQNLPEALNGLTIAQISDVHIGQLQGEMAYVAKIIATVNALNADIMTVTGDVVDGSVNRLASAVAPLAGLKSKYGTFFVTGNHEYYSGATAWIEHFKTLDWRVLQNEHEVVNINGTPLVIAGVQDLKAGNVIKEHACNPKAALDNAPTDAFRLLLAHHPSTAELTDGLNVDLQLSGHTHAGQYFPATWIVQLVHKFSKGLNKNKDGWVYVNSGTGYWGPPLRSTDVSGEITLLTLKHV